MVPYVVAAVVVSALSGIASDIVVSLTAVFAMRLAYGVAVNYRCWCCCGSLFPVVIFASANKMVVTLLVSLEC